MTIGVFDPELHARYKALPPGPEKRRLHGRLVVENAPLVKLLLGQMLGKAPSGGRKSAASRMAGCGGFDEVEPDDAYQLGLVALSTALERLDPAKGKLAYYTAQWLRHYLRRWGVSKLHLIRAPEGKTDQRPGMALVGLASEGEERASADERGYFAPDCQLDGILESENVPKGERLTETAADDWLGAMDPEELADDPQFRAAAESFAETGVWPAKLESLGALRAGREARKVYSFPSRPAVVVVLTGLDLFVRRHTIAAHGRVEVAVAYNAYRIECRIAGLPELPRAAFVKELTAGWEARETRVRTAAGPRRAIAGLRLQTAA